jgi:hypothetical protein
MKFVPGWPTQSAKLETVADFLEMDEYDFFGYKYTDPAVIKQIRDLRHRVLPERALVLTPRGSRVCDSSKQFGVNTRAQRNRTNQGVVGSQQY